MYLLFLEPFDLFFSSRSSTLVLSHAPPGIDRLRHIFHLTRLEVSRLVDERQCSYGIPDRLFVRLYNWNEYVDEWYYTAGVAA